VGLVVHLGKRVGIYPAADDIPSNQAPKILMSETAYCYHCGTHHPIYEMREILTKSGKRWRCIKSILASRQGRAERQDFGVQTTANNRADTQDKIRRMPNPERNLDS